MKKHKISVIIPVYNMEKTIGGCLESVLSQKYPDFEVIVIDNNSNDESKRVVEKFSEKTDKLKIIDESRIGRSFARNAGINNSNGDIIFMTDADCIVPDNWIKDMIKPIINHEAEIVMGSQKDIVGNYWSEMIQKAELNEFEKNRHGKFINQVDTKNFAVKKSIIKKYMFDNNLGICEDFDLYLRIEKNHKIVYLPNVKVGHNHRNTILGVSKLYFKRAVGIIRIRKKYPKLNFKTVSAWIFFTFPIWMIIQFITKPFRTSFFIFVTETSWRLGMVWGYLSGIIGFNDHY